MRGAHVLSAAGVLIVLAGLFACGEVLAANSRFFDWQTIRNDRHGFRIAYPSDVFEQRGESTTDDGRLLVSRDGKARLLVGAFENGEDMTLHEYREYLLQQNYAGAAIDYAPVRAKWFVLSGTRGGQMFYERVSFTCGGRLINSWAMLYPEAERRFYDRVVEAVARTYTPGAGRSGQCD